MLLASDARQVSARASDAGIQLRFQLPLRETPAYADPQLFRQVLLNFLSNAVKVRVKACVAAAAGAARVKHVRVRPCRCRNRASLYMVWPLFIIIIIDIFFFFCPLVIFPPLLFFFSHEYSFFTFQKNSKGS